MLNSRSETGSSDLWGVRYHLSDPDLLQDLVETQEASSKDWCSEINWYLCDPVKSFCKMTSGEKVMLSIYWLTDGHRTQIIRCLINRTRLTAGIISCQETQQTFWWFYVKTFYTFKHFSISESSYLGFSSDRQLKHEVPDCFSGSIKFLLLFTAPHTLWGRSRGGMMTAMLSYFYKGLQDNIT